MADVDWTRPWLTLSRNVATWRAWDFLPAVELMYLVVAPLLDLVDLGSSGSGAGAGYIKAGMARPGGS